MRKIFLLTIAALSLSFSAQAQGITDKIEAFGGYSFQHMGTKPSFNTNGWEISGQYKLKPWLGVAGDVDGHYGTFEGVKTNLHNFFVGPQVSFPARVSPFAHVLIGGSQFSATGQSSTSFASAYGFGLDMGVAPQIAWRLIQFDVVHSHTFGESQNSTRVSTGIVFHF